MGLLQRRLRRRGWSRIKAEAVDCMVTLSVLRLLRIYTRGLPYTWIVYYGLFAYTVARVIWVVLFAHDQEERFEQLYKDISRPNQPSGRPRYLPCLMIGAIAAGLLNVAPSWPIAHEIVLTIGIVGFCIFVRLTAIYDDNVWHRY